MDRSKRKKLSDQEADQLFNEILSEDDVEKCSKTCLADCAEVAIVNEKKTCECMNIALNSSRFTLLVMEAMRSMQTLNSPTSSMEDIVNYIEANYRDEGDLYSQVRTALIQVCSQGFVVKMLKNKYHLIGPVALSMNRNTCSTKQDNCVQSSEKSDEECDSNCDSLSVRSNYNPEGEEDSCCEGTGADTIDYSSIDENAELATLKVRRNSQGNAARRKNSGFYTDRNFSNEGMIGTYSRANHGDKNAATERETYNKSISEEVNDIYRKLSRGQVRKNAPDTREKELKRWIENCQKECEERKKKLKGD